MNTQNKYDKILILGCTSKSAIIVARELKSLGHKIDTIDWHNVPAKHSRYFSNYFNLGNPKENYKAFHHNLIELLKSGNYDIVLPIHDPGVEICIHHKDEIRKYSKIIGVNQIDVYKYAHDKWALLKIAEEHKLYTPKSILISEYNQLQSANLPFDFPVVVKPISSSFFNDNRLLEIAVKVARTAHELEDIIREYINVTPLILQEYINGYGIGFNIFAINGKIINAYIHRRINENGGVSSYRESIPIDTYNLTDKIAALVQEIKWTGPAMIEFKVDNNIPYLMEMNGRFWGSIEVGVKSQLNYPKDLYLLETKDLEPAKNKNYRLVKVRNFHDELFIYMEALFKGRISLFFKWVVSLLNAFKPNNYIEDNVLKDPGFIMGLYQKDLKRIFNKVTSKFRFPLKRNTLTSINEGDRIAFICFGNICRSPFAADYAKTVFPTNKFSSYGLFEIEKRLPPTNAVKAAEKFGIDINDHLSLSILGRTSELNSNYDYFVVMDENNLRKSIETGLQKNKIKFLSQSDIKDPYGCSLEIFTDIYTQIRDNINRCKPSKN
jgi:protein-tyrosine-phosphatase/predicted ATP-grasp superfamily ATP-dependent carboligase